MKTQSDIQNRYRYFKISFLGPTNSRPSRVKIYDMRRNKGKFISYDAEFRNISDMAINYLESVGIQIDGMAIANKDSDCLLLTKNFLTDLK